MEDSLITVKEVADYLKLKEQTVYLLARQNKIPSLKVGGSLRFKKSQIDTWLATTPKTGTQETRQRVLIVDDEEMVREALKEQGSGIEEGKADILGLYMITQLHKKGQLEGDIKDYYTTFLASVIRSVRLR